MNTKYLIDCASRTGKEKSILALAKAFELVQLGNIKNVTFVCPNIGHLTHNDLGEAIDSLGLANFTASRLKRHEPVQIGNTAFDAIPSSKISQIRNTDVIIAECLSPRDMAEIDKLHGVKFVIFIPYHSGEYEPWKSNNNPDII